MMFLLTT